MIKTVKRAEKKDEGHKMTTVYLIRHAEAEGNLYRRCHGHYDAAVTARGYRQIAALAKRFENKRIDAVYSSDLTRTKTTALALTRVHGLPLHTTPELREVGMGAWEDKTWTWLGKFDRERLLAFNTDAGNWHVEGGEDMPAVLTRMRRALRGVIAAHPGQTVAVFSHGMALRLLVGTLQGLSVAEIDGTRHAENTAVTKLIADEDVIRVIYRDDASHLSEDLTTLHKQLWTKTKGGIEPGLWFRPDSRTRGRFEVMQEDGVVGALSLHQGEENVAVIDELWLENGAQGHGFGVRLVGQAVSYARTLGCTALSAVIPRGNPVALKRAIEYGFLPGRATPDAVVYQLYTGKDESYRTARFDEAWEALREK